MQACIQVMIYRYSELKEHESYLQLSSQMVEYLKAAREKFEEEVEAEKKKHDEQPEMLTQLLYKWFCKDVLERSLPIYKFSQLFGRPTNRTPY